jgi:hypothetical protein
MRNTITKEKPVMQRAVHSLMIAAACGSLGQTARANCDRLFEAFDKADKQERVAQYDIDSRDQPLTGKPMTVRIGKVMYDGTLAGNVFEAHQTNGVNPVLAALRKAKQDGKVTCDAAGGDTYRGQATEKIKFDNPLLPAKFNPMTIWIGKNNGLPVYHELNDLGPGGFAWVYGSDVKDPMVKK